MDIAEALETPDTNYLRGFNEGYLITQHLPSFIKHRFDGLEKTPRGLGFLDGQKQCMLEKNVSRLPWMHNERNDNQRTDKTKDKNDLDRE